MFNFGDLLKNVGNAIGGLFNGAHPAQAQYTADTQPKITSPVPVGDTLTPGLAYYYGNQQRLENQAAQNPMPRPQQQPVQQYTQPVQQQPPLQQYTGASSNLFPDFTYRPVPQQYQNLIYNSAKKVGLDPSILASLLNTEHGFLPTGNSPRNTNGSYDRGMAQINNVAHPDVSDEQANNPEFAVPYAANLLENYIRQVGGDYNKGIAAYNVGVGGVENPQTFKNQGQVYLHKVAGGLSKNLLDRLGIKY